MREGARPGQRELRPVAVTSHLIDDVIDLCHLDDIKDGQARGFDLDSSGRDDLFVVRRQRHLYAYRNNCPHQNATLPWRENAYLNADGDRIVCAAHGAQFDIATGQCTLGAALGQRLASITVHLSDRDVIQVRRADVASHEDH